MSLESLKVEDRIWDQAKNQLKSSTQYDTAIRYKWIEVSCSNNSFHNVNRILISMSNYSFEYKFTNYSSTLDYQSSKLRLYIQSSRCLKDPKTEVQCQWMCFRHMYCRDAHQAYLCVIEKNIRDLENDLHSSLNLSLLKFKE